MTIGTVSLNGMAGDGIDVTNSAANITINGGTIGNTNDPGGIGVDINGGSGNVTIGATITKNSAGGVDVVEVLGPNRRHGRFQRCDHVERWRRRYRSDQ